MIDLARSREIILRIADIRWELAERSSGLCVGEFRRSAQAARALETELDAMLAELGSLAWDAAVEGDSAAFVALLDELIGKGTAPQPAAGPASPAETEEHAETQGPDTEAAEATALPATAPVAEPPAPAEPASAQPAPLAPQTRSTPPTPASKPVAVTAALVASLQASLRGAPVRRTQPVEPSAAEVALATTKQVRRALNVLGATPSSLAQSGAGEKEVVRFATVLEEQLDLCSHILPHANRLLTTWLVARLRAARQALHVEDSDPVAKEVLRQLRRIHQHVKATSPGSVHGLAAAHAPRNGDWLADARSLETQLRELLAESVAAVATQTAVPSNLDDQLRRLNEEVREGISPAAFVVRLESLLTHGLLMTDKRVVRLATPFAEDLDTKRFGALRRAILAAIEADEPPDEVRGSNVPLDWPHFGKTRGRKTAIVGGEPRPERVARLQEAFGFASLDWIEKPTGGPRHVDALIQRMRNGTVDLVIVLRAFSAHKVSDKVFAARDESCPVVLADTYGVTQVRLAIERFLGRD